MNQKGPVHWSNTSRTCKGQTEVFYPTLSAIDKASGIEPRGGMSIADGMTYYTEEHIRDGGAPHCSGKAYGIRRIKWTGVE